MMQDLDVLSQLVKTTAQVPLENEYGKRLARLTEPKAPDSEAIIRNIPEDAMVIKVDRFLSPDKAMKIDWPNHLQFNHLAGLGA